MLSSTLAGKRGCCGAHPQRWRVTGPLPVLILNAAGKGAAAVASSTLAGKGAAAGAILNAGG
ncbi:hypothetical protein MNU08_28065 [Klebsiella pneumoniae]|nr:hypothetical protein [Klebsiella pneumoniae]